MPMASALRPVRLALLSLLLAACDAGGPEYVYIPTPTYQQSLVVRADLPQSGRVPVNRWVTLHANRLMGPWQRVRRVEVPDSVECVRATAPPSRPEIEIANKLRWRIEPREAAEFNLPGPPDFERQIRFAAPGRYRVWAVSELSCHGEFTSDTLEIVVE